MFRYRCPHCSVVLQAPEIRAGKTTVCSKCSHALTIPADKLHWLNEKGEPLLTSPTMVIPSTGLTPPPLLRPPSESEIELPAEADNDVLGAISHGEIDRPSVEPQMPPLTPTPPRLPTLTPTPAPAFSRSLPDPDADADDGRVELYPPMPPTPVAETPRPPRTPSPPAKGPTPPPRLVPRPSPAAPLPPKVPTPPPRYTNPEPAWSGASSRSPARAQRVVQAAPIDDNGSVAVGESLRLRTGMDLAVDLTSALALRMKPAPKPPRDLKPSTAIWVLATGIGVALLAATLVTTNNYLPWVMAIAAAQVLAGYAWVAVLVFRRDPQRGAACLVPPLTFYYLMNRKYARYRPLRFVAAGAVLAGLAALAPQITTQTRRWADIGNSQQHYTPPPEIATLSKLEQLRYYRDQRQYDSLIGLLRTLARTDSMYSEEAKNRVDLATELRALCQHTDSWVKIESLAAYAAWGGPDARELCLEASRSRNSEEREMALRLLPRWKDEDVARRIAEMIGRAGKETSAAQDALITLGGPIAERAAIPLLRKDDQGIRLTAMEILGNEKVGGADAVAALKEVARLSPDPGTRMPAAAKAELIQERLKK